jgi:hypothetical protein
MAPQGVTARHQGHVSTVVERSSRDLFNSPSERLQIRSTASESAVVVTWLVLAVLQQRTDFD